MRLAAIGDNCIDYYTNLEARFPGGGPVNFAVQAQRLGAQTAYIGVVGDDIHGDWIIEALNTEKVDTTHVQRLPGKTAVAYVELQDNERVFLGSDHGVRNNIQITPEIVSFLKPYDLIHTTLDGCVDAHIPGWHADGYIISYDFSHRATEKQRQLLPYVSIAFFSGQDMSLEQAGEFARSHQARHVTVVTLGERGSIAYDGSVRLHQPAVPIKVVDTLGAGDAFQAGFVVEYMTSKDIQTALRAGAHHASLACMESGGFGYKH